MSLLLREAVPEARSGSPNHPLQHRRVRQRLHHQPLEKQQILHGPELRLRPLPPAPHPPEPVPVSRGELPPLPFHGAELLPPVPPSPLALH